MTYLIQFGQAGDSVFFQRLDLCCQKVAEKMGDGNISGWTNSDYIRLSRMLQRETKVHLSENTLKRIFGKVKTSERYHPQKATRDALAQFAGYRDWYEFELLHPTVKENNQGENGIKNKSKGPSPISGQKKWYYATSILLIIGTFAYLSATYFRSEGIAVTNVKLVCVNPEGLSPHSAIFKLDIKGDLPDSLSNFTIDFMDQNLEKANFNNSLINHYYEIPGRYYPVLSYKGKPLDTGFVYLQTKGWTATITVPNDTTRVYPVSDQKLAQNKILETSAMDVLNAGVDTSRTFFVNFTNVRPTSISADNFEVSAFIKGSENRPGVRCSQADIVIYGETDKHHLGIIKPECVAWTYYKFSENIKDGEKSDLRALGHDLRQGSEVRLVVKNRSVKLLINSKVIFTTSYKGSIGKIMGIRIMLAGIGRIEKVMLKDLLTGEVLM